MIMPMITIMAIAVPTSPHVGGGGGSFQPPKIMPPIVRQQLCQKLQFQSLNMTIWEVDADLVYPIHTIPKGCGRVA